MNANVARHELIGHFVTVGSAHAGWNGLEGTVVDETMNTFLVEKEGGSEITIPKAGNRFVFRMGKDRVALEGSSINFRPEDRTKKVRM